MAGWLHLGWSDWLSIPPGHAMGLCLYISILNEKSAACSELPHHFGLFLLVLPQYSKEQEASQCDCSLSNPTLEFPRGRKSLRAQGQVATWSVHPASGHPSSYCPPHANSHFVLTPCEG